MSRSIHHVPAALAGTDTGSGLPMASGDRINVLAGTSSTIVAADFSIGCNAIVRAFLRGQTVAFNWHLVHEIKALGTTTGTSTTSATGTISIGISVSFTIKSCDASSARCRTNAITATLSGIYARPRHHGGRLQHGSPAHVPERHRRHRPPGHLHMRASPP